MKNHFTKQKAFSFLTIIALIVNVSISGISNSTIISFLIKLFSSALLISISYIHLRLSNLSISSLLTSKALKKILFLLSVIIFYLSSTLFYSLNPDYGFQKIFNIIISVIPNIIVLFYLVSFSYKKSYNDYFFIIITTGLILTIIPVLLLKPFDHSIIYQFSPKRWSHVFIGRMAAFLSLIVFLYLLSVKEYNKIIIYTLIFTIGLYLTYLTGLRSALIGLTFCTIISLLWYIYRKNLTLKHLYGISLIIIISSALYFITPQGFNTPERINNIIKIEDLDFGGDEPIITRVASYKLSWQMFVESPLVGFGFGSFNGFNNIEWTTIQKYPHNIILEILSELGIIGFFVFGLLFIIIIKNSLNLKTLESRQTSTQHLTSIDYPISTIIFSHFVLITLSLSVWFAMFSKDISTQGFLWLYIIFAVEISE